MGEFASDTAIGAEVRALPNGSDSAQVSLFTDLWNGRPISLPTQSWALHRIEKSDLGPLVIINEMMANSHGIPFPLKQLVISSTGSMIALVLNQIIDVSLISSILPLRSIEDLQEALKYFDEIDCEYVYVESV